MACGIYCKVLLALVICVSTTKARLPEEYTWSFEGRDDPDKNTVDGKPSLSLRNEGYGMSFKGPDDPDEYAVDGKPYPSLRAGKEESYWPRNVFRQGYEGGCKMKHCKS